jgi:hypothetical protein
VVFLSGFKRNTPVEYNCYSGFIGDMGSYFLPVFYIPFDIEDRQRIIDSK